MRADFIATPVVFKKQISSGVYEIGFKRRFDFDPGQVIGLKARKEDPERLYSISSGVEATTINVLFDVYPSGYFTPVLAKIEPGDTILISRPRGEFLDIDGATWWIATGTGIAPFLSMVRSGHESERTLIHGARSPERFYRSGEFLDRLGTRYIRCLSKGDAEGCISGRLTDYLRRVSDLPRGCRYMLCGSAEMVVEVRDILLARMVRMSMIVSEIYF